MDNKHYFGLYFIRIKHSLVLFSLFLIALQSLAYLILAVFSDRVRRNIASFAHLIDIDSFLDLFSSIFIRNCSFCLYSLSFDRSFHICSTRKVSACSCLQFMSGDMAVVNLFFHHSNSSSTIHFDSSSDGSCHIYNSHHSYDSTVTSLLDGLDGLDYLISSFYSRFTDTSIRRSDQSSTSDGIQIEGNETIQEK